jgi:hypothetical protein
MSKRSGGKARPKTGGAERKSGAASAKAGPANAGAGKKPHKHDTAHHKTSTSALLLELADSNAPQQTWGDVLDRFEGRAFGIVILIATIPAFIPSPVGAGLISGPIVALLGLQMLFGLEHPWLPKRISERKIEQKSLGKFATRLAPWFKRIERLCRPRLPTLFVGSWPRVTGLLAFLHGIALSLPIPFTNYPFAFVLVLLAIALIEDDGVALIISWASMLVCIGFIATVSGAIVEAFARWF